MRSDERSKQADEHISLVARLANVLAALCAFAVGVLAFFAIVGVFGLTLASLALAAFFVVSLVVARFKPGSAPDGGES